MPEKELSYIKSHSSQDQSEGQIYDVHDAPKLHGWAAFKDLFKRYESDELDLDPNLTEAEKTAIITANSPLLRSLKNRHLQMIAIGGSIGTGLFVGSGKALRTGGPAGILIGWIVVGVMIYTTVQAMGEPAVTFPVSGSFTTYNIRFLDPSWGFAMAWNYTIQWLIVMPLELVAAAMTVRLWNEEINGAAWVVIFYACVFFINFFGVRGYGEAEFVFSLIKVIAVVGFIILGIILVCGGGPKGGYLGGKYWHNPGAFANGFKGVCTVFVTAAFSFNGTELCGLAAAETENPRKSLPKATKQVFWRITLFYVICLTLIGLLVQYDDDRLLGSSSTDANASPFVIAIRNGGISGLPSVMNVVIMIAVLSVGNSAVFALLRTLAAMAAAGLAPKIFNYIDKQGRPLVGIITQLTFGLLCFLAASPKEADIFAWMMALSGLLVIFTWGTICATHLRFRYVLRARGRNTDELAFSLQCGEIGLWIGLILNILVLVAQFWTALFPLHTKPNPTDFFQAYLAFPVIIVCYVGHKVYAKNWRLYIPLEEIDIDTGRRELDIEALKQELAEERAYIASRPWWYRTYSFWC